MQTSTSRRPPAPAALLALCAALAGFAVQAAPEPGAAERHRREVAACNETATPQNRAACLEDAFVAYREARRGTLGDGLSVDPSNLTRRCDVLKTADRDDCLSRMRGAGTTSGSVEGGGIYRELVTRTQAPAPASAAASAPEKSTAEPTKP